MKKALSDFVSGKGKGGDVGTASPMDQDFQLEGSPGEEAEDKVEQSPLYDEVTDLLENASEDQLQQIKDILQPKPAPGAEGGGMPPMGGAGGGMPPPPGGGM
jgi:hypothetical protein